MNLFIRKRRSVWNASQQMAKGGTATRTEKREQAGPLFFSLGSNHSTNTRCSSSTLSNASKGVWLADLFLR